VKENILRAKDEKVAQWMKSWGTFGRTFAILPPWGKETNINIAMLYHFGKVAQWLNECVRSYSQLFIHFITFKF
jgi:hypothetical protein